MNRIQTTSDLIGYSTAPIKRAISRAIIRWQLRSMDSHIASLEAGISNDRKAVGVLQKERTFLALRLR